MADLPDINVPPTQAAWASAPVVQDKILVQSYNRPVAVSLKDAPGASKGIVLQPGEVLEVPAGRKLSYRSVIGDNAILVREVL